MHTIERKMLLIEEVLKAKNDSILDALENALLKIKNKKNAKSTINDFVGVITEKEATQMQEAIKETAETINQDDWK